MKRPYQKIRFFNSKFFVTGLLTLSILACSPNEDSDSNEEAMEQVSLTNAETILMLVNKARADEGLQALILNEKLNDAAYKHSLDMDANNYFNHEGLDGSHFSERTKSAGYTGSPRGENIAKGQPTEEAVHEAWMNSDGHRANILNKNITEMGLGLSGIYWTQIFGKAN